MVKKVQFFEDVKIYEYSPTDASVPRRQGTISLQQLESFSQEWVFIRDWLVSEHNLIKELKEYFKITELLTCENMLMSLYSLRAESIQGAIAGYLMNFFKDLTDLLNNKISITALKVNELNTMLYQLNLDINSIIKDEKAEVEKLNNLYLTQEGLLSFLEELSEYESGSEVARLETKKRRLSSN